MPSGLDFIDGPRTQFNAGSQQNGMESLRKALSGALQWPMAADKDPGKLIRLLQQILAPQSTPQDAVMGMMPGALGMAPYGSPGRLSIIRSGAQKGDDILQSTVKTPAVTSAVASTIKPGMRDVTVLGGKRIGLKPNSDFFAANESEILLKPDFNKVLANQANTGNRMRWDNILKQAYEIQKADAPDGMYRIIRNPKIKWDGDNATIVEYGLIER